MCTGSNEVGRNVVLMGFFVLFSVVLRRRSIW